MRSCENCARMYLQEITTKNLEEGVSGVYERYACKKGKPMPAGVCARKDLLKRSCELWRKKGTVIHVGDCISVDGEKYVYCGTIGKFYKKRMLRKSTRHIFVSDDFLKDKECYVYNYFPDLAKKHKERYLEKIRSEKCDNQKG